jgi:hypothetical protein
MIMGTIARVTAVLWVGVALTLPARAGLVGHWRFDEGSGTVITDSSGLGNQGVLVNPKTDTWTAGRSAGSGAL